MQDYAQQGQYQPPIAAPQQPKKKSVGKILGIGCLVVVVIGIIVGGLLCWGGKKAINLGIEMAMKEMRTDVLANYDCGSLDYDVAKYEMDMIVLLAKQKEVSLMDFVDISDRYDELKIDGEIDIYDAEILVEMVEDFNESHSLQD